MRKDQRIRLTELSERIAEFAIDAADPDNWGLSTSIPRDMTADDKIHGAGTLKMASQAVGLLVRVESVIALRNPIFDGVNEPKIDNETKAAEKRAEQLLSRIMDKHGKAKA